MCIYSTWLLAVFNWPHPIDGTLRGSVIESKSIGPMGRPGQLRGIIPLEKTHYILFSSFFWDHICGYDLELYLQLWAVLLTENSQWIQRETCCSQVLKPRCTQPASKTVHMLLSLYTEIGGIIRRNSHKTSLWKTVGIQMENVGALSMMQPNVQHCYTVLVHSWIHYAYSMYQWGSAACCCCAATECSLCPTLYSNLIFFPADITAPNGRLGPGLQRALMPAFLPSWDAFPWGHSQWAQQRFCPHMERAMRGMWCVNSTLASDISFILSPQYISSFSSLSLSRTHTQDGE